MVRPVSGTECPVPTDTGRARFLHPQRNYGAAMGRGSHGGLEAAQRAPATLAPLGPLIHPCLTQVALVVFTVHTLVTEENAMDAEKAFVTLTVLNILNKAQAFLPFSIHSVVQVRREAHLEEPSQSPPTRRQSRRKRRRQRVRKGMKQSGRRREGQRLPQKSANVRKMHCLT